jgi:putative zinc finger protein
MVQILMTCKELEALTTEYLEEALASPRRQDFEAHLDGCPNCQKHLGEMRALIGASHTLGGKLNEEWRKRAAQTQGEFFEKLQAKVLEKPRAAKELFRKLAPATGLVAIIAIIGGVWLHHQAGQKTAPPVTMDLTIDLSHWVRPRGEQPPAQQPLQLARARLNLTIRLPIGEEPGEYQVAVRQGGTTLVQTKGDGKLEDHITRLHVYMDCTNLNPGPHVLAIRQGEGAWEEFPVVVR